MNGKHLPKCSSRVRDGIYAFSLFSIGVARNYYHELSFATTNIELGSTAASDYELLADLLARSGKTSEAIMTLQHGLALNPCDSRLYKALALEYISIKAYGEALQTMKKELELFPEGSFMRMLVSKAESTKPRS